MSFTQKDVRDVVQRSIALPIGRASPCCGFGRAIRQQLAISALGLLFACSMPAATPKKPVTDDYFGTKIVDDYRWLEAGNDAAVQQWSDEQNAQARSYLDALPGRGIELGSGQSFSTDRAPSQFTAANVGAARLVPLSGLLSPWCQRTSCPGDSLGFLP